MENKYQLLTTEFFDRMEKELNDLKKKKSIVAIVTASTAGLTVLSLILTSVLSTDFFEMVATFAFIACIITLFIGKKMGKKIKSLISVYESNFYDQVFAPIVAGELGGTAQSRSFKAADFKKQKAVPGYILSSRDVELEGMVNGKKFHYVQAKEDVITEVLTETKTNSVVSYNHFETRSDIELGFETRKNAATAIKLTPMTKHEKFGRRERIVMDDKGFRFHVDCDDELFAYKYLTADVMEGLEAWKETSGIKELVLDGTTGMANYSFFTKGLDLEYEASFSKNMEKNRTKYTADIVLAEAMNSVNNIRSLMEAIPNCIV